MAAPDFAIRLGLVGAGSVFTELKSLTDMIGSVVSRIQALAEAADQYGNVIEGHRVSIQAADEATNHLVNTIDLHRQAARLEAAGINVTSEQYRSLVVAAVSYSKATGTDAREAVERLTQSVIRGSDRGLRPFGIALQQGGTLAQRQERIMASLTEGFSDQTVELDRTADAFDSLKNSASTAFNEILLALERNAGPLRTLLNGITSAVSDLANALETQRRAQEHLARMGTEARQREIQHELNRWGYDASGHRIAGAGGRVQRRVGRALDVVAGGVTGDAARFEFGGTDVWAQQQAAELDRLQRETITNIRNGTEDVVGAAPAPTYDPGEDAGRGGGGGGRQNRQQQAQARLASSEIGLAGWDRWVEAQMDRISEEKDELERSIDSTNEQMTQEKIRLHEQDLAMLEERTRAEEEGAERMIAAHQRYLDSLQYQFEEANRAQQKHLEGVQQAGEKIELGFGTTVDVVTGLTGALKGMVGENDKATRALMIIEGTFLVAFNVAKAATEIALAISDTFNAGKHAAAAALHTAAAVVAGINLGSKVSASKQHASAAGVGQGTQGRVQQGNQPVVVVHVNGVVTSQQVHEQVMGLQKDAARAY